MMYCLNEIINGKAGYAMMNCTIRVFLLKGSQTAMQELWQNFFAPLGMETYLWDLLPRHRLSRDLPERECYSQVARAQAES